MGNNGNNFVNPLNPKTNPPSNNMSKDLKKEIEIEDNIRDYLKCYICLTKVIKPKMCKFCKRICCERCINRWMETHNFCGVCKHNLSQ